MMVPYIHPSPSASHPSPHDVFQAVGDEVSVLSGHIHLFTHSFTHSPIPSSCDAMEILSLLTWPRLSRVHVGGWLPLSTVPPYSTHLASNETCSSLSLSLSLCSPHCTWNHTPALGKHAWCHFVFYYRKVKKSERSKITEM